MFGVFAKSFRDARRTMLWLGLGLGAYGIFILAFYPSILDQQEELNDLMETFPSELLGLFGGGGAATEAINIADPGFYLHSQLMIWTVLILGAVVTFQAFNAITNAERNDTMDILLSLPISRREMIIGRFLNTAATVIVILSLLFITLFIGTLIVPEYDVTVRELALAVYGAFFIVMVQAGLTYMLAALVPSSQRWPGAVVYTIFLGSYLFFGFANSIDFIDRIRPILMFNYYDSGEIINQGYALGDVAALGGAALVFFAVSWWAIDRKQLGV